jgi:hypothetical protein
MGIIIKKHTVIGNQTSGTVRATFDTNARDSFVRKDIAEHLGQLGDTASECSFIMDDGRGPFTVDKFIPLDVVVDETRLTQTFYVVDDLAEELIIGADMIRSYKMDLDFDNGEVSVDPEAVERAFRLNSPILRVVE